MLKRDDKEKIWYLYKNEHLSKSAIATKLGIARNTVIKVLCTPLKENEQLLSDIKDIQDERNRELLELIKNDNRLPDTVNKILNTINNEELITNTSKQPSGIKSLMTIVGVLTDKHIAGKRVEQEERRLKIQERMADIKERELEARMENPDAFTNVTILNDSDKVNEWYDKHGTDKPYKLY